jgi:hypothetical protein
MAEAGEFGYEAGVRSTGIQASANMFNSANQLEAAQLQYDRLPRGEQLAYNQGGLEGLQQYRSATNPGSENMRIMRLSNQQELENQRRSAYGATMDQLDKDFESEASGFSSWIPNSNRTEQILDEQKRLQRRGMSEADAYDAALGTVSRNIVDARFGPRPGVDDILRDDRYDVPRNPSGQPPRTPNLSEPGLAPTNTVPGRVFIPRGRGISGPIQQPSRGNWPPNE